MYSKITMKQRILLTGKDGIDLLQRITTLDFNRLSIGQTQPGLILNPQGKILSYFEATRTELSDQFEITFEDQFLDLLDQFTFGERYQIDHLENLKLEHELSDQDRIQNLVPKLGKEFFSNGETNPLEINLSNAIHDQKGCYPGQEVIEKIISLGSPSKKLCLVKAAAEKPIFLEVPFELNHGKLTSFVFPYGLAVVRKTHSQAGSILLGKEIQFTVIKS
jgi:folate-binding protein YgfZ